MLETENNETHLVCVVEKGHEGFRTRIFTKDSLHSVDIYFFFYFLVGISPFFGPPSNRSKDSSE